MVQRSTGTSPRHQDLGEAQYLRLLHVVFASRTSQDRRHTEALARQTRSLTRL